MKRNKKQANFAMRNIWTASWGESKNDSKGEFDGSK